MTMQNQMELQAKPALARRQIWWATMGLMLLGSLPILTGMMSVSGIIDGLRMPDAYEGELSNYVRHPWPILLHIGAGTIFNLVGPFQFAQSLRARHPRLHHWLGRTFIFAGLVAGFSAFHMNQFFPAFGGMSKYLSNLIFSLAIPFCLGIGLYHAVRRNIAQHRAFMIRAYAVGLGVATQRLLFMPYFMLYGIPEGEILGILLIIGWAINLVIAEWIIRRSGDVWYVKN